VGYEAVSTVGLEANYAGKERINGHRPSLNGCHGCEEHKRCHLDCLIDTLRPMKPSRIERGDCNGREKKKGRLDTDEWV
jgi:hypothetical protein